MDAALCGEEDSSVHCPLWRQVQAEARAMASGVKIKLSSRFMNVAMAAVQLDFVRATCIAAHDVDQPKVMSSSSLYIALQASVTVRTCHSACWYCWVLSICRPRGPKVSEREGPLLFPLFHVRFGGPWGEVPVQQQTSPLICHV